MWLGTIHVLEYKKQETIIGIQYYFIHIPTHWHLNQVHRISITLFQYCMQSHVMVKTTFTMHIQIKSFQILKSCIQLTFKARVYIFINN